MNKDSKMFGLSTELDYQFIRGTRQECSTNTYNPNKLISILLILVVLLWITVALTWKHEVVTTSFEEARNLSGIIIP